MKNNNQGNVEFPHLTEIQIGTVSRFVVVSQAQIKKRIRAVLMVAFVWTASKFTHGALESSRVDAAIMVILAYALFTLLASHIKYGHARKSLIESGFMAFQIHRLEAMSLSLYDPWIRKRGQNDYHLSMRARPTN
ncbi:MAG TPA: hypothetical protein VIF82_00495 [Burkholderiaceae bacterium]|jgi:hypothetical protein